MGVKMVCIKPPKFLRVRVTVGGTVRHMNVCTRCLRSGKVERAL